MANTCGCGNTPVERFKPFDKNSQRLEPWIIGNLESAVGPLPIVSTQITRQDRWGAWKVRWGIGRMSYAVPPGLYAVGKPNPQSPVLVTANYKLSLDALRRELTGTDAWLLILDTRGINVWCAAGKGTFGTDEIVARIAVTRLPEVVAHRRIILPQLGAPGVSAHLVAQRSGFTVDYGPVRACDLPAYLAQDNRATLEMRQVTFTLRERLSVVPVEIVQAWKPALIITIFLALITAFRHEHAFLKVLQEAFTFFGAFLTGTVFFAALLPWLPFRAFAVKGFILGLVWAAGTAWLFPTSVLEIAAGMLLLPAISAFLAMNFTGASTFTSPTGAVREVKAATPIIAVLALAGVVLKIIAWGLEIF